MFAQAPGATAAGAAGGGTGGGEVDGRAGTGALFKKCGVDAGVTPATDGGEAGAQGGAAVGCAGAGAAGGAVGSGADGGCVSGGTAGAGAVVGVGSDSRVSQSGDMGAGMSRGRWTMDGCCISVSAVCCSGCPGLPNVDDDLCAARPARVTAYNGAKERRKAKE